VESHEDVRGGSTGALTVARDGDELHRARGEPEQAQGAASPGRAPARVPSPGATKSSGVVATQSAEGAPLSSAGVFCRTSSTRSTRTLLRGRRRRSRPRLRSRSQLMRRPSSPSRAAMPATGLAHMLATGSAHMCALPCAPSRAWLPVLPRQRSVVAFAAPSVRGSPPVCLHARRLHTAPGAASAASL